MNTRLRAVAPPRSQQPAGPLYRLIVAIDLEGSTKRTNPVKGELRRVMYDLLERSLDAAPVAANHLEPLTDRGDGALILIRPHDDVPKTVLLDRLIPLLDKHNAAVLDPALRMRLRAVVHAGEIHEDNRGFYGEAIDVAIRLLDSTAVKTALRQAKSSVALVVSEDIYFGIVAHDYVDSERYRPLVRVRVTNKQHRGWVCFPVPCTPPALPTSRQSYHSSRILRSA